MAATKQELYNTIDLIPDSVAKELLNYADYLTSKYIEKTMLDRLIIKAFSRIFESFEELEKSL